MLSSSINISCTLDQQSALPMYGMKSTDTQVVLRVSPGSTPMYTMEFPGTQVHLPLSPRSTDASLLSPDYSVRYELLADEDLLLPDSVNTDLDVSDYVPAINGTTKQGSPASPEPQAVLDSSSDEVKPYLLSDKAKTQLPCLQSVEAMSHVLSDEVSCAAPTSTQSSILHAACKGAQGRLELWKKRPGHLPATATRSIATPGSTQVSLPTPASPVSHEAIPHRVRPHLQSNDQFKKSLVSADKTRKHIRKSNKSRVYDVYGDIPSEDIASDIVRPQLTLPAPARTLDGPQEMPQLPSNEYNCKTSLMSAEYVEDSFRESLDSASYDGYTDTPTDEDFRKSIESGVYDECGDILPEDIAGPQLSIPAPAWTLHGDQEMRQMPSALYDTPTKTSLPTPTSSLPTMPSLTTTTRPQSMMESDEFSPPGFSSRTATQELSVWTSHPAPANSVPMASTSNSSFPGATTISMNMNNIGRDDTA